MSAMRSRLIAVLGTLLLVTAGIIVGALLLEAAYRVYLRHNYPHRFTLPDPEKELFSVYSISHWEFDKDFGYIYPPGRTIDQANIADGRVVSCDRISVINKFGNIGPIAGDWATAQVKIAVFGDSWTAFHHNGKTWPHFLHEILEKRLAKSVAVMNFGRDGYGVLQMFDLAAAKISEWKPDIAVFAFITDDLTRARFWRTVVGQGDDQRVLTTTDPVRNPREDRAVDTILLMNSASHDWCTATEGTKLVDPVLSRLVEKNRMLRLRVRGPEANAWDLRHSYLFNRLWRGKTFWHVDSQWRPEQNPRHEYSSYAEDKRLMEELRHLRSLSSKLVLFHLAFYPEIKAGKEYLVSARERTLLESLETVVGVKVFRTTDYVALPVDRAERMNSGQNEYHPSLWGMEFYANAVADALFREGILEPSRR